MFISYRRSMAMFNALVLAEVIVKYYQHAGGN
jgi:hypothetical protein